MLKTHEETLSKAELAQVGFNNPPITVSQGEAPTSSLLPIEWRKHL